MVEKSNLFMGSSYWPPSCVIGNFHFPNLPELMRFVFWTLFHLFCSASCVFWQLMETALAQCDVHLLCPKQVTCLSHGFVRISLIHDWPTCFLGSSLCPSIPIFSQPMPFLFYQLPYQGFLASYQLTQWWEMRTSLYLSSNQSPPLWDRS